MSESAEERMSVAGFLAWADRTAHDVRYELLDGVPRAMAPCTVGHLRIARNIVTALAARLSEPCEVVGNAGIRLPDADDRFYEADAAVTCAGQRSSDRWLDSPVLVIEVLSESTAGRDRDVKVPDYAAIPTVTEILLVDSRVRRVQLWRRDGARWIVADFVGRASVSVPGLRLELPLDELYARTGL